MKIYIKFILLYYFVARSIIMHLMGGITFDVD